MRNKTRASTIKLDLMRAIQLRVDEAAGARPKELAIKYAIDLSTVYSTLRGSTHPPVLSITLDDASILALDKLAKRNKQPIEAYAARLLRGALEGGGKC